MSTLADEFTHVFREEHRQVRDLLLELVSAFEARDGARAREALGRTAALTGPHFRYEEESLYPALVPLFGSPYVEHLLGEHDRAIQGARRLVEIVAEDRLGDEEAEEAVGIVRSILPHVSDCDGLSIMVEVLPEEKVGALFAARERSLAEGLDLLTWADGPRGRG